MSYDPKKTYLLGFGFFSVSLMWAIYNSFVPIFLGNFLNSEQMIGWVMTIDNVLAVILIPVIGIISDRTKTKYGRRMPFIMIGIPIAAVLFSIVPFHTSLLSLMIVVILTNLAMALYRSPVIALMPDITPMEKRSQANGIINFMGGFGAVLAYGIGSKLFDMNKHLPFIFTSVMMLFALFMLIRFVKEPKSAMEKTENDLVGLRSVTMADFKKVAFLLFAIFFWFVAYQGIEALFTRYGTIRLGFTPGESSFLLTFFSLAFLIFAIPAGFIGSKLGKKKTIMIGIIGFATVFLSLIFITNMLVFRIVMCVGGIFWACININSYPMVVEAAPVEKIGAYTGMYYFFSSLAAIASPPLLGFFLDTFGFDIFFPYAVVSAILALVFMILSGRSLRREGSGTV